VECARPAVQAQVVLRTGHLPDGTVAVRVVAALEDHLHPGRTFRTSRAAPLRITKPGQSPGEVVVEAALRAVLSIEEHEMREQLAGGWHIDVLEP
jgi:hypothetical protein